MPQTIIELLKRGIEANIKNKYRKAGLVSLPNRGHLIVTGDLHGHRRNFEKIVSYADLTNHPDRHIVLQEIIHGGEQDLYGGCISYQLLFDVIQYKIRFPHRVHLILGNHDTAFINNSEVMKNGEEMNQSMRSAMDREYQEFSEEIKLGLKQFLFSQPLAVRCANGVWCSHSLPSDRFVDQFDYQIFERPLRVNDVVRPGSAYLLTWGRRHSPRLLDKMAQRMGVKLFILGHQPQQQGWRREGNNLLILACDHNHGCIVSLDLDKSYTVTELTENIVPLASIE